MQMSFTLLLNISYFWYEAMNSVNILHEDAYQQGDDENTWTKARGSWKM